MVDEKIDIFQWNSRSIRSNRKEFEAEIKIRNPHVIILQSLGAQSVLPILDSYYMPDHKKGKTPAGLEKSYLATYFRKDIKVGTSSRPDFLPKEQCLYSSFHTDIGYYTVEKAREEGERRQ